MTNRRHLSYYGLVLLMFCFSIFIAWCVPYTHDDWDWGRAGGITNWLTGVYNNRYVGTFFVIVMTRSRIIKTLIMAITMTCLPLLCVYLSVDNHAVSRNRVYLCVLAYFVAFAMPVITWRQTYGWVAGFSNFTMGAFLMLALMALLKHSLHTQLHRRRIVHAASFLLGFAAQLCAENVSFFFPFFLAAAMLLTQIRKHRNQRAVFLFAILGTLLGTVLMFSNPLYENLAVTGVSAEHFRSLTFSLTDPILTIIQRLLALFFGEVLPSLYETHPVLVCFLAIGAWIELFPSRRTAAICMCLPMMLYGIFCCYCAYRMRWTFGWLPGSAALRTAGAIVFTVLWLISVLISTGQHKWQVLAFSLFALALITPFAAIRDIGPRCYHISHFCLLICGITRLGRLEFRRSEKLLSCVALAVIMFCLTNAYAAIGATTVLREELTRQALDEGATTLVLPSVSGEDNYSWGYNPQGALRAETYREYYGLPEDMELIFLPYGSSELWPNIPEEMYQNAMIYPEK